MIQVSLHVLLKYQLIRMIQQYDHINLVLSCVQSFLLAEDQGLNSTDEGLIGAPFSQPLYP